MPQTVWKVVSAIQVDERIRYYSSLLSILGDLKAEYVPGKCTYPPYPGSYLYAFDDKQAALDYIHGSEAILKPYLRAQVWEAQAEVVGITTPRCSMHSYEDYWDLHMHALPFGNHFDCPTQEHTVWCAWVKITDLIRGLNPEAAPEEKRKTHRSLNP